MVYISVQCIITIVYSLTHRTDDLAKAPLKVGPEQKHSLRIYEHGLYYSTPNLGGRRRHQRQVRSRNTYRIYLSMVYMLEHSTIITTSGV